MVLAEVHMIVRRDIEHVVILPSLDHLWKCYPSKEGLELEKIKNHMTRMGWLCDGKWNPDRPSKEGLKERPGVTEHQAFKCIADIFNDLLQYHQSPEGWRGVESVIYACYTEPKSSGRHQIHHLVRLSNHSLPVPPFDWLEASDVCCRCSLRLM